MSTPHQLPPARFDRRIAVIYDRNQAALATANTPILLLCGGTTDLMVPSESCILPDVAYTGVYRRTVFSNALELHTHSSAPFTSHTDKHGLNPTLYALPDCKVASLHLRVDWWASLGRAGARYWTAVPGWVVGIVTWTQSEGTAAWFLEGTKFENWLLSGSLLWIHG